MKSSEPQFKQYEMVRVNSTDPAKRTVAGQRGVILGCAEKESGGWYYTAHVESDSCCWCFDEDELVSLGQFADVSDFYDGSSMRVAVDDEGRGTIVSDPDPNGEDTDDISA
jgi:hypothetical protein